jgi:hypothetical protein
MDNLRSFISFRSRNFQQAISGLVLDQDNWYVINPKGDGNCLIYALASLLIDIPDGDLFDIMLLKFIEGIKMILKKDKNFVVATDDNDTIIFRDYDDDGTLALKYLDLVHRSNICSSIIRVFSYAFNVNIVLVCYDEHSVDPLQIITFTVPNLVSIVDGQSIEDLPKIRFIISAFGHNFSLVSSNYSSSTKLFEQVKNSCVM